MTAGSRRIEMPRLPSILIVLLYTISTLASDVVFSKKPSATRQGNGAKISFALSTSGYAEVSIVDGSGKVVRHLAAGMIGGNAPAPDLMLSGLSQEMIWDGNDDSGK